MERALKIALILVVWGAPALADVVFLPPPPKARYEGEVFPESRFGSEPMQPGSKRAPASLAANAPTPSQSSGEEAPPPKASSLDRLQSLVPDRAKGIQEVALIAGDLGYFPKTVFVTRDVPVRLFVTGASKGTLCVMMDAFNVRKQVRSQKIEEITFTPSTPGKFRFYCPVNGMEGTLVVRELAGE
jgi:hypothetical protein